MLDLRYLRENADEYRQALKRRGMDDQNPLLDELLTLDAEWRHTTVERDRLREEQNAASKRIGALKRERKNADALIAEMQSVARRVHELDKRLSVQRARLNEIQMTLPNPPHADVPDGSDEKDNVVVKEWGEPKPLDFEPLPHWTLGERLDILDLPRAAKIAGSGFAVLKGDGARLTRSLLRFMLDQHTQRGYTEIWAPALANRASMSGTGQLPKFEEDMYRAAGHAHDLFLIPTAEVPLTNMHADEILDAESMPIRYCGYTPCFRREAGAAGRDTRGILRVHQFDKVELVKIVPADASYDEHESLLADAEHIVQLLEIPYRVVLMCAGDLDFKGAKQYDIEIWSAGEERWLEVSSVSNFEAFQSRRAGIRYRPAPRAKPEYAHTLNGSGVAVPRLLISLLENNQQADGSVAIPPALAPYFGAERIG